MSLLKLQPTRHFSLAESDTNAGARTQLYVGHLPDDCDFRDLKELSIQYGPIKNLDLKNRTVSRKNVYGFVEYENAE